MPDLPLNTQANIAYLADVDPQTINEGERTITCAYSEYVTDHFKEDEACVTPHTCNLIRSTLVPHWSPLRATSLDTAFGTPNHNKDKSEDLDKMKENDTILYPNPELSLAVTKYSLKHSTKLPKHMHLLDHHAWGSTQEKANFMISPSKPSSSPEGHVTGLEFSLEYANISRGTFSKNNPNNVQIIVGDARDSIKNIVTTLEQPYDPIFIDADKTSYPTYIDLILSLSSPPTLQTHLLRSGCLILADNILHRALVADSSPSNPWSLKNGEKTWKEGDLNALKVSNDLIVSEERLETFLLPLFDGIEMGRLKD
ncbi:hypothetical protein EYC80_008766 [Monilinia laxa]|uniref:O-methyltransferase domain-containing protein n=1 Tax=Monilinia laxa TaxID=61186 RepID=A0A5N6K1B0_MONLA|nr:hypothetical protein EYC80_008766 [Monilinia laxa]